MQPPEEPGVDEAETLRLAAFRRERRSQLRGLLLIALATFLFLLYRAQPLHLFHPDWWRL